MSEFTVNFVLASGSLAILGALLYTILGSSVHEEGRVRYSYVILSYLITILLYMIRIILVGKPGSAVFMILWIVTTLEEIFCAVSYPLLILYLYPVQNQKALNRLVSALMKTVFLLSLITLILSLINPTTGYLFRIDGMNRYIPGPLIYLPETFTMMQIACLTAMVFSTPEARKRRLPVLVFFLIICIGLISLYINPEIFLIYPLSVLSLLLIYVNIINQREQNLRRRQLELEKNNLSLLIGQIQPHFVFNVLNTIYYLCDSDRKSAAEATAHLRMYLMKNFEEIFTDVPVPFEEELEIVRNYTDLEKLRFEQIEIVYDIQDTDFMLPALSVQPLVENAIRHGLREMRDGRVVISSKNEDGVHVISVTDNGVGFQPPAPDDNRRHVGIENVRRRLTMMSSASLEIQACEEGGTKAVIRISS